MNDQNVSPEVLEALQRETFDYFVHEANPLTAWSSTRLKQERRQVLRPSGWPCHPIPSE